MEKVVVAGAGFAGIQAALSLGRKGFDVEIIDKNSEHIYTPGLIDLVRGRCSQDDLAINTGSLFGDTSVDFFEEEIIDFRPEEKIVVGEEKHGYDYLVLALGGEPILPDSFEDVILPYNSSEAEKLRNLEGEVAVIGSGYTGIEYACELGDKGLDVTVYDMETRPVKNFSEEVSEKVLEVLYSKDIKFKGGKEIERIEESEVFYDGGSEEFDHVVANIGVIPDSLLGEAFGNLKTNRGLSAVNYENVFVLGDCNNSNRKTAHDAMAEAKIVAENIGKKDYEELVPADIFEPGSLVSMGDTGLYIRGKRVLESRLFRYAKDVVRKGYILNLRRQSWMLKNLM